MNTGLASVIVEKVKAGYPGVYLVSQEHFRVQLEIIEAVKQLNQTLKQGIKPRELFVWTLGEKKGLAKNEDGKFLPFIKGTDTPHEVLAHIANTMPARSIAVLKFFHHFLDDVMVQALLLDMMPQFKKQQKTVILLCPLQKLPPELEKEFAVVELSLPDKQTLGGVLDGIVNVTNMPAEKRPSADVRKELVEAATGLTTTEAENAFSLAYVRPTISGTAQQGTFWEPQVVIDEKCATLRKTGLLEFIPTSGSGLQQIGGMDALKQWVRLRRRAFTDEARAFGLPHPKGMLMVGPPGSGKSLGAKAVSAELRLPLIRCDMGKLFGSLVGQSEANMRMAIQSAEAMAPCILWIDEIEKGLSGTSSGLDSGVGARLLGYLLTWMQEKTTPVFVYATANNVSGLPPELLRKGRFDEMFSVILPDDEERKEILAIHLTRLNRGHLINKPNGIALNYFSMQTAGFSGAEIESAIHEALHMAFDEGQGRDITAQHLETAIRSTIPLSKTMADHIKAIERWCENRTRPASGRKNSVDAIMSVMNGGRVVEA